MEAVITGRTRGGAEWVPQFVTAVDAQRCIGCGRCYKVCPRDVFELVERSGMVDEDDDLYEDDEEEDDHNPTAPVEVEDNSDLFASDEEVEREEE